MKRIFLALFLVGALSAPVAAQTWGQKKDNNQGGSYLSPNYGNSNNSGYGNSRPAKDAYDRPTLSDPQPRRYGKDPSLGDSRTYRRTSPKRCTGLLCD